MALRLGNMVIGTNNYESDKMPFFIGKSAKAEIPPFKIMEFLVINRESLHGPEIIITYF